MASIWRRGAATSRFQPTPAVPAAIQHLHVLSTISIALTRPAGPQHHPRLTLAARTAGVRCRHGRRRGACTSDCFLRHRPRCLRGIHLLIRPSHPGAPLGVVGACDFPVRDGGNRGTLWCRRARDSSPLTESTLLSQPLHVYGLSASCLWCGCVEADDKYGRSLLASNMYVLTPSRKGVFARLPAYLEASRAPAVYDRRIDSPQTAVMQTRNASDMDAVRKLGAASATSVRRKTLCDITNLRRPLVAAGRVEVRGRRGWDRVVGQGKIC
nr:uncharacterized protein LOC109746965 isoform X1 [Aegilops tauschii subsp. strangulata]